MGLGYHPDPTMSAVLSDPETTLASEPLQVLAQVFGYTQFRGAQQEIVDHVVAGGDALVLMPTAGGKRLCYQVPAVLRHRAGQGVTVVVSPPTALMHALTLIHISRCRRSSTSRSPLVPSQ